LGKAERRSKRKTNLPPEADVAIGQSLAPPGRISGWGTATARLRVDLGGPPSSLGRDGDGGGLDDLHLLSWGHELGR
jgi:hypothetical protein